MFSGPCPLMSAPSPDGLFPQHGPGQVQGCIALDSHKLKRRTLALQHLEQFLENDSDWLRLGLKPTAREGGGACLSLGHHKGEKEHYLEEKREGVFYQKSRHTVLQKSNYRRQLERKLRGHLQSPSDSELK